MQALRVTLTETLAYWTVVDQNWRPVEPADSFLRHLRLGADRAEGTTRAYAGDLATFLAWCQDSGRDLIAGARDLSLFVAMLKTTPVTRVRPARKDEKKPWGFPNWLRQRVEAIIWTLKNQLGIERLGGRAPAELWARSSSDCLPSRLHLVQLGDRHARKALADRLQSLTCIYFPFIGL